MWLDVACYLNSLHANPPCLKAASLWVSLPPSTPSALTGMPIVPQLDVNPSVHTGCTDSLSVEFPERIDHT